MKEGIRQNSPETRKYINEKGKLLNRQARLNLYRKHSVLRYSKNPLIQQRFKDNISRSNNELATQKLKVHQAEKKAFPDGLTSNNSKEVVNTMAMATGKPNLGLNSTDHLKSGNNVNSDIFKNKWDKNEW